jgi:hypothetical protein
MLGDLTVTLTTGSMNRLEPLRRALATWTWLREVDEIIIVDWGSREPLRKALADFEDPRISIVRTEQPFWCNSKCHNLEIKLARKSGLLFRLDNDTLVRQDFFQHHPFHTDGFYAGNWRTVTPEIDDKRNLTGTLLCEPRHLLAVNGYNERLVHYGKEDDDLYARLVSSGLRWYELNLETLEHIPHTDKARYENLAIAPEMPKLAAPYQQNRGFSWADRVTGTQAEKNFLIALSDRILAEKPWSPDDQMTSWLIEQQGERYYECRQV